PPSRPLSRTINRRLFPHKLLKISQIIHKASGTGFALQIVRTYPELWRCHMLKKLSLMTLGLVMMGGVVFADTGERKNLQVFDDIATTVNRYTQLTIFDDVDAVVKDGLVTLTGEVTMPYK